MPVTEMKVTALALDGGTPVRITPLPPWPHFAQDEIDAATAVLSSGRVNYWTGTQCAAFEQEFAQCIGTRYAISLANGTVALELALHALDIGAGDDVIVPARSFLATASCVIVRGARPVFADIDPISGNISAATAAAAWTPHTRALIAVHLAGYPCDMEQLVAFARERNIKLIEDCAQSHGATFHGRMTGSFGDIGAFSFCHDKIMTTGGEGGMLVTDDPKLWERAWSYKDHGKSYEAVFARKHPQGFRWLHESFGTNWRMTEMQAAIGRRQLTKLQQWVKARKNNAMLLHRQLQGIDGLRLTETNSHDGHAFYKYYVFVDRTRLGSDWTRERIIDAINAEGIPCISGACSEMYLEKAFTDTRFRPKNRLPVCRTIGETSIMFMVHPTLMPEDIADTATAIRKVMRAAVRSEV
jgi:dTDP-4-amino-4,6-dideoxygalactose transaminase